MKFLVLSLAVFAASSAFALDSLPVGTFNGTANWKDTAGKTGNLTVDTVITADTLTTTLSDSAKSTKEVMSYGIIPTKGGFFKISNPTTKRVLGRGYCMDNHCHFSAYIPKQGMLEESFTLEGKILHKVGSLSGAKGVLTAWHGDLNLK